jgi:hypothetical protein
MLSIHRRRHRNNFAPVQLSRLSIGPQNKTGLVTTALPIEPFSAFFPLPDLLEPKHPKDLGVGHCNTTPISFAPHELTQIRIIKRLLNPQAGPISRQFRGASICTQSAQ